MKYNYKQELDKITTDEIPRFRCKIYDLDCKKFLCDKMFYFYQTLTCKAIGIEKEHHTHRILIFYGAKPKK